MRVLIFGNSGSGKSTYARTLATSHGMPHLDLDTIVWERGAVAQARPTQMIRASLDAFLHANGCWAIEGCYGELIEAAAPCATELVFLNPGVEVCVENNRCRPSEPHKYASAAEQAAMFAALQEWVAAYYTRRDTWSYAVHRRIFVAHPGPKREYVTLATLPE